MPVDYNQQQRDYQKWQAEHREESANRIFASGELERKKMLERTVANLHANEAEREKEQTLTDQEKHEQSLREALRQSYIKANGSEFGFAEAWPRLRAAHVEAQTLANLAPKPATTKEIAERTLALRYGKGGTK